MGGGLGWGLSCSIAGGTQAFPTAPGGPGRQVWGAPYMPWSSDHNYLRIGSCYFELLNRACAMSRLGFPPIPKELLPLSRALCSEPASRLVGGLDREACLQHRGRRLTGWGAILRHSR